MTDELEKGTVLSVAGVVQVTPLSPGKSAVRVGPSAGWLVSRGISSWESELSFVARTDMTAALARAVHATLPVEQIAPKRFPMASSAVATVPFLALAANVASDVRKHGVRVHTVGVDRVSAGFYYFAEGGSGESVEVQGSLIDMLAPSIAASSSNADIADLVKELVDRLLVRFSGGAVSELDVELANALPRLACDATGLAGTDLDGFEALARGLADASARWEPAARRLARALTSTDAGARDSVHVPLYGSAKKEFRPPLDVVVGGKSLTLEATSCWTVSGAIRDEPAAPVRTPVPPAFAPRPSTSRSSRPPAVAPKGAEKASASPPPAASLTPAPIVSVGAPSSPREASAESPPLEAPPIAASRIVSFGSIGPETAPSATAPEPPARDTPLAAAASPEPPAPAAASETAPSPLTAAPEAQAAPVAPGAATAPASDALGSLTPTPSAATAPAPESAPPPREPEAAPAVPSGSEASASTADRPTAETAPAAPVGPEPRPTAETAPAAPAAPEPRPTAPADEPARPRSEPTPVAAAAMAPSGGRSPISGLGFFVLFLLAAIAYVIGRLIRHHYLHRP